MQEVTVQKYVFWDIGSVMSLYKGSSNPVGPRASFVMGARCKSFAVKKTLSVPDSRGIDSGPSNDLRLEAVLSEVLAEATQNP